MNVTFLIGNGFDLNLGLDTRYTDFIKEYKNPKSKDSEFIKYMKKKMDNDSALWSNAELALGDSTKYLSVKDGENPLIQIEEFSLFHIDLCESLAAYLDEQQERIPKFDKPEALAKKTATCLNGFLNGFREASKNFIQRSYSTVGGGFIFNFIVFNYTHVLDDLITTSRKYQQFLGSRSFSGKAYQNTYGEIIHVHGTTKRDMVFAVNDETQISNIELYKTVPDYYLHQLIKIETNRDNEQRTDEKAREILTKSHLLYIYGMSLGETDRLWWKRIVELMNTNPNLCVIVQQMDAGDEALIRTQFLAKREQFRDRFVELSSSEAKNKKQIKDRIFLTSYNLFNELTGMVPEKTMKEYAHELIENELANNILA